MNVLRISSRFHPAHPLLRDPLNAEKMRKFHAVGGMQLQVYLLTRTLAQQGVQQDVVTVRPPWEPKYEEKEGVRIHRFGWAVPTPRQMYAGPALRYLLKIAPSDYDLVHCHIAQDLASVPLSIIAARRANAPLVITLHSSWQLTYLAPGPYQWLRQFVGNRVEGVGLRYADAVIALTSGMANRLVSCYGLSANKISVIPDAVDIENMQRRIGESELKLFLKKYGIPEGPKVVFIGRLSHQKGVSHLIKAFIELRRLGTEATLVLAGDGPYRPRLQREVLAAGINDRVVFIGSIHHDDVPLLLAITDVMVVPSIYEEFGSVLLEAMAVGVPIVASRVGGIPSTIKHGENGLLVPPRMESQLTSTIQLVLRDRDLAERLGRRAALDARKYDLSRQAQAVIEEVYMPVLKERPSKWSTENSTKEDVFGKITDSA